MINGYKIYFNQRCVILTNKIIKSFEKNDGLFYKYQKKEELIEILFYFEKFNEIKSIYVLHDNESQLFEVVKSCYTIIEAAGGVVRRKDGTFLAIFRRGKWDLPKGKVEKGEFYTQTALREIQEECGLTQLTIGKKLLDTYHVYHELDKTILKRTIWYDMELTGDETPVPQTEEGITEIKWFDYHNVGEIMKNTYESLKDVFNGLTIRPD